MYYSLFEIFAVGIGPFSSHTVGPMRAAKRFLDNLVYQNKQQVVASHFNLRNDEVDYLLSPPMACNKIFKRELFDDEYQFKLKTFYEDLELIPTFILKTNKIDEFITI